MSGDNYRSVLRLITKVVGSATDDDMWFVTNPNAKAFMQRLPAYRRADFTAAFPMATSQAADLLSRLLEFDYKKRMPVEEALAHPYFADIRDQAWEVSGDDNTLRWGDIDSATPNRLNMQRIILEDAARLNVANVELLKDVERRAQLAAEQHQAATHLAQQQALAQQQQQHRRMAA